MNMKSQGKGIIVLFLIALIVLLGCPTGGSTDSVDTGGDSTTGDTATGGGGGGGGGNGPSGAPNTGDNPGTGSMSEETANKVFGPKGTGWAFVGDSATIKGFVSTAALTTYLNTGTSSWQYGGALLAVSGGTRMLTIGTIGGKLVAGIEAGAFSPTGQGQEDITRVVAKIVLPSSITSLGTGLFTGVAGAVIVDIPVAVIAEVTNASADEAAALGTIIGSTDVTVIKGGNTTAPIIQGAPVLEKVEIDYASATRIPTVKFMFNVAITASGLSVSGSPNGTFSFTGTTTGTKTISVTSSADEDGKAVTITFTATATATASGKSTTVSEPIGFWTADKPAQSQDVKVSTSAQTTTSGLSIASATKTGNTYTITLAGTSIATASLPGTMGSAIFPGAANSAVITLNGILIAQEAARIQQANPALEQYVTTLIQNDASNQTYGSTAKTQQEIEAAFENANSKAYFWKTDNPVTYNKLKNYAAGSDDDFSILLQPPAASDAIKITKIDARGATTFTIDYSGVSFQ